MKKEELKKMNYSEFVEKYHKPSKQWKFELFDIVCKKCESKNVEFNGALEVGTGYYGDLETGGSVIIKCHGCGNAFSLDVYDLTA